MKIKNPVKRKLLQIAAFGFSNFHIGNFKGGELYTGAWKKFCNPGLNCYSCPAASFACPIGALQAVSGSTNYNFSFYVIGFLLAVGILFGRFICGWFCPFGLIQELINKNNLHSLITLLGYQSNPYPILKKMDAFILTSRYEGQGMVFLEAKCLDLDIIMPSHLEKYVEGIKGTNDIRKSLLSLKKRQHTFNDLSDYNNEIIDKINNL